jgi:hypothetical protein
MDIFNRKEKALFLVAFASLKNWNEPTTPNNIEAEMCRLERIIEQFYIKEDKEYNQFVLDFLKENANEIVYGDNFLGDAVIPDKSNPDSISGVEFKLHLN